MPHRAETKRLILALDAAGDACSVALGGVSGATCEILAAERAEMKHGHAAALVPMVERVMMAAGIELGQVGAIACGIGPGGFTGLRIALATARGLGLALDRPVIGISSFQAAAAGLAPAERQGLAGDILVLIDSRREEPYAARLGPDLTFRQPPRFMTLPEIAADIEAAPPALVTGDAVDLWPAPFPATVKRQPQAADARAILRLAADPDGRYAMKPAPLYLRAADVSVPKAL